MKLLDWIQTNMPGEVDRFHDRLEIRHTSGDRSILWLKNTSLVPPALLSLGDIYLEYDGMDLFSSAFKIASLSEPKFKGTVAITFNLHSINEERKSLGAMHPADSIAFMYQAGIGIYSVAREDRKIYEWDTETGTAGGVYSNILEILEEWREAIYG